MKRALLLVSIIAAMPASAALDERALEGAVARPPAQAVLPGSLVLTDLQGRSAPLERFAAHRPMVLIFADFTCRNICGPGLTLTAASLEATGLAAGRDYRLAVIGLDPRDSRLDALHFGKAIGRRPNVARSTMLLRGDASTIAAATRALGYGFAYDAANDQYAHDASVYVFARDGTLAAVLPELGLRPEALRAALTGEQPSTEQGWAVRVAHLCYGFAAAHGRFGRPIVLTLQASSLLLLTLAAGLIWRRRRTA